jgi:SAM-dependent methyltransferase
MGGVRIPQRGNRSDAMATVDLYDSAYTHFARPAEAAVRAETYGEDIGQSSWMTADEWRSFFPLLALTATSRVLEVGCGSGGPAVDLARTVGCRVVGIDVNEAGVDNATALATRAGVADRAEFRVADAGARLPFDDASFDAIVSNDAMCHVPARAHALAECRRVLRPGGRVLYTDAMVVTGGVTNAELATRSSIGVYLFVPPGENERLIAGAGLALERVDDLTSSAEAVARRWHDARAKHRAALVEIEGETNFDGLQRFLACVHLVSRERRLSRFLYLARRPTAS